MAIETVVIAWQFYQLNQKQNPLIREWSNRSGQKEYGIDFKSWKNNPISINVFCWYRCNCTLILFVWYENFFCHLIEGGWLYHLHKYVYIYLHWCIARKRGRERLFINCPGHSIYIYMHCLTWHNIRFMTSIYTYLYIYIHILIYILINWSPDNNMK